MNVINPSATPLGVAGDLTLASTTNTSKFSRSAVIKTYRQDMVFISQDYRNYQTQKNEQIASIEKGQWATSGSSKGVLAGSDIEGVREYLQSAGVGLGLNAINSSRQDIGRRLDDTIKKAGIKLGKDEKISISIDGKNQVKVAGIKDAKRAREIEKAIAKDEKLTQDIRRHHAHGRVNKDIQTLKELKSSGMDIEGDLSDLLTGRNLRAFVIDDYLQQKTGTGLSDLAYEEGMITGINQDIAGLFNDDPELAATVQNILENGEQDLDFSVSFEFRNGTISDGNAEQAAKEKIKTLQGLVMGLVYQFNDVITKNNAGLSAEELQKLTISEVKIRADELGEYEVVGAEDMDPSKLRMIKEIISIALDEYSGAKLKALDPGIEILDSFTGGEAVGNFADIVGALVESHRLEDFDTDEFAHKVEIDLNSYMGKPKLVSPEADEAREQMNQEIGQELGQDLRSVLEENNVDVGNGIEVEIDGKGKIRVKGDLSDANLRQAQQVLDSFASKGLAAGATSSDEDAATNNDRLGLHVNDAQGNSNGNAGKMKRVMELNNETNPGGTSSPNIAKFEMPEYTDHDDPDMPEGKARALALAARYRNGTQTTSVLSESGTSRIRAPRFAGVSTSDEPFESLQNEHMLYADSAKGKFQHLVDSLNRFHDGRQNSKVSFTIV